MNSLSIMLITLGIVLIVFGLLFSGGLGPLGKLPGDIKITRPNFTFYFPIATSIVVSIVLSLTLWIISRWMK